MLCVVHILISLTVFIGWISNHSKGHYVVTYEEDDDTVVMSYCRDKNAQGPQINKRVRGPPITSHPIAIPKLMFLYIMTSVFLYDCFVTKLQ